MRDLRFTFLCTVEERKALDELAGVWHRSKGDTVRQLILNAFKQLGTDDNPLKLERDGGPGAFSFSGDDKRQAQ